MATPFPVVHLEEAASTMDEARALCEGGPVLVTADRQTRGRGRSGREWIHADRAIAASLAMRLEWDAEDLGLVPLLAGLAAVPVFDVDLKWPNDLLVDDAKVGGILAEHSGGVVVVGMGVNLYWADPIAGAGALYSDDPGGATARDLAVDWAARLVDALVLGPGAWDANAYEAVCTTIGRRITFLPDGEGTARGVDHRGRLIVDTPSGRRALDSGEVRHVRRK